MNKLLFLLLATALNTPYIIQQGSVKVYTADVDAFVHGIPELHKERSITDLRTFEKNIYSILNMNLVYTYIVDEKLNKLEEFETIKRDTLAKELSLNPQYVKDMGYSDDEFLKVLRSFELKKKYYRQLQEYYKNTVDMDDAEELAKEMFLFAKDKFHISARKNISQIVINKDKIEQSRANEILSDLLSTDDKNEFLAVALEYSDDPSVSSNQGNLGVFTQESYGFDFSESVFNLNEVGIINKIFMDNNAYYIIRINESFEARDQLFDEVKEKLINDVVSRMAEQRFQATLNLLTKDEIQINKKELNKLFTRYDTAQKHKD